MNENQNGRPNGPNNNNNNNNNKKPQPIMLFVLFALIAMFVTNLLYNNITSGSKQSITYTKFLELVEKDQVKSVVFEGDKINIKLKKDASYAGSKETEALA